MTTLASLQRRFAEAVTDPRPLSTAVLDVKPGGTLTPEGALGVYRTAYPVRLTEQLCETFEGVWSVLGDELFFRRCREYIAGRPSTSYNLSDYGSEFPEFLKGSPESEKFPFLPELAGFERAFMGLFHEKEHAHASGDDLAGVGPETVFVFGGAVRLFRHAAPVVKIWTDRKGQELRPPEGVEHTVLFKLNGEILIRFLDESEYALLVALKEGRTVGAALAAAEGWDAERVGKFFAFLGESGMVEGIRKGEA